MPTTVTLAPKTTIRTFSFDPEKTAQSVLCLEVGQDRFQLLVRDKRGQASCLEDYRFSSLSTEQSLSGVLPDVFRNHEILLAGPWQEVRIGINSASFTLIPEPLFRKEYAASYLALMRGSILPTREFAQVYAHKADNFLSVFNLEHALFDYFSEMYALQPLVFVHQTSALIQATADLDRRSLTADSVYLYFEDEFVTMLCWKEHQLRYCNRFGYKNVQDLAYYILYVLDEQSLAAAAVPISLFGEITPFSEAYSELSRFLPNLSFGPVPAGLTLAPEFSDLPDHRYLSLYGLGLMSE
ncbi:DUF3822 family protein [Spirosoma luteum]|uniref:DUF3822 family protein n=1 Tax=Spirosoma luteum TaxID=431553 RepID=UPI001FE0960D|nr:DUF3822 family protein [Spirosoma luteum]